MEAMTTVTAAFIDRGLEDYMLETAMLKVFTTERLWECINDVFQIYGGSAYFTDLPLERMLRDARINQIGEGANEVLTSFIALSGCAGREWSSKKFTTR
jgi:Acyl-CoA dehydrogenases